MTSIHQDKDSLRRREVPPLKLNTGLSRFRLPFGYLISILCLVLVKSALFLPGVAVALLGIAIRLWAAGYIIKRRRLTMEGPYALTRNPLYFGSFLLGLGSVAAIRAWWLMPVYLAGFALFYWPTIRREEEYLADLYGDEFAEYRRRVPAFFPWKLRLVRGGFSATDIILNREHIHALVYLAFLALLELLGLLRASGS